jgi:tRNA1(Val) A37 N6-methylase TrmN6
MACSCASLVASTARHYDESRARKELASYRNTGPGITTRGLLDLLRTTQPPLNTLLDIGAGIGALTLGLLEAGVGQATCVDLSTASLAAAAEEAERQGVAGRITWVNGDFVAIASTVPAADLVTLDRVVCCYPEYAPLLEQAAGHSRQLLAMSYPRNRWWVRLGIWIENAWRQLRGNGFRAFLHSPEAMAELLAQHGFERARAASTWTWQVEIYTRDKGGIARV